MLAPNTCLAGVPLILLGGFALLVSRRWSSRWAGWIHGMTLGVTAFLAIAGLVETLHGSTSSLQLQPVPGFAAGLAGTTSGYATCTLTLLCAGWVVLFHDMDNDSRSCATLALSGLAIASLGDGMLALVVGAQLIWVALFGEAHRRDVIGRERWLGLLIFQAAVACLMGAVVWQQTVSATTSFGAIPAAAGAATAVPWVVSALLAVAGAGLIFGGADSPAEIVAAGLVPALFVFMDLTRLHDVVDPSMPAAASALLIAVAILLAPAWVWRTTVEKNLMSARRWLWLGQMSLLLLAASFAATTFDPLPVMAVSVAVVNVLLAASLNARALLRALCILAAAGSFAGLAATSAAAATSGAAQWHPAAGWVTGVIAVLLFLCGVRVAVTSRDGMASTVRRDAGAALALAACFALGLIPGLLQSSLWSWLNDSTTSSQRTFSIVLPGAIVWPGGIIAVMSVALAALYLSSKELMGWRRRVRRAPEQAAALRTSALSRWESVADWCSPAVRWLGDADNWLAVEPRFASVVLLAMAALVILH